MRMTTPTLLAVAMLAMLLLTTPRAKAAYSPAPNHLHRASQKHKPPKGRTPARRAWIICRYWRTPAQCNRALNIAWCESTLRPWARNGQYHGIFQMGSYERSKFGHGRGAWAQARAAHAYYTLSGWRPWECTG